MHAEVRVKYFFCVKISTRMLIRLWKSLLRGQLTSRPSTPFSSLHHLCALLFFHTHVRRQKISLTLGNQVVESFQMMIEEKNFSFALLKLLILNDWPGGPSVPLRRPFEMHLDRLLWVSDIHPVSIRLPSFGDNLDQNSSHWRVRNMGDTLAAGFHIHFQLLVLP
jgi:hypothetical protein